MTPQEMNLEVRLGLQKVNSSFYDEFNDEEIDAALNKMQQRFVNKRFLKISDKLGFEEIQKRLDDVRGLIVRDRSLTFFNLDTDSQYAILPPDYLYLISDVSQVDYHCDGLNAEDATAYEALATVQMPTSADSDNGYYSDFVFTYDTNSQKGGPITDSTLGGFTFSDFGTGFSSAEEKYRVIDLFLEHMADMYRKGIVTFQVYFERYKDNYAKDTFYFVSHKTTTTNNVTTLDEIISGDGVDLSISVDTDTPITNTGTFASVSGLNTRTHEVVTNLITRWSKNRLTESEELYGVLEHSFGKTDYRSPVSSIDESRIVIYHDETFILKGLKISYIRKPNKISLALNRSCELADHTHPEIVDMTVSNLLERVEARRYQTSKIEENLNE